MYHKANGCGNADVRRNQLTASRQDHYAQFRDKTAIFSAKRGVFSTVLATAMRFH